MTNERIYQTYFVGFQNLDTGKTGSDTFTSYSESNAKHDFFECYRHHNYKILCVVCLDDAEKVKEVINA